MGVSFCELTHDSYYVMCRCTVVMFWLDIVKHEQLKTTCVVYISKRRHTQWHIVLYCLCNFIDDILVATNFNQSKEEMQF